VGKTPLLAREPLLDTIEEFVYRVPADLPARQAHGQTSVHALDPHGVLDVAGYFAASWSEPPPRFFKKSGATVVVDDVGIV